MTKTAKSCEKMRDFTKKYFHLNKSAVYNSSAKKLVLNQVKGLIMPTEHLGYFLLGFFAIFDTTIPT